MAEQKTTGGAAFKEAVCIDAGRVYDSCSEMEYSSLTTPKTALLCAFSVFSLFREDLTKEYKKRAGFSPALFFISPHRFCFFCSCHAEGSLAEAPEPFLPAPVPRCQLVN